MQQPSADTEYAAALLKKEYVRDNGNSLDVEDRPVECLNKK